MRERHDEEERPRSIGARKECGRLVLDPRCRVRRGRGRNAIVGRSESPVGLAERQQSVVIVVEHVVACTTERTELLRGQMLAQAHRLEAVIRVDGRSVHLADERGLVPSGSEGAGDGPEPLAQCHPVVLRRQTTGSRPVEESNTRRHAGRRGAVCSLERRWCRVPSSRSCSPRSNRCRYDKRSAYPLRSSEHPTRALTDRAAASRLAGVRIRSPRFTASVGGCHEYRRRDGARVERSEGADRTGPDRLALSARPDQGTPTGVTSYPAFRLRIPALVDPHADDVLAHS